MERLIVPSAIYLQFTRTNLHTSRLTLTYQTVIASHHHQQRKNKGSNYLEEEEEEEDVRRGVSRSQLPNRRHFLHPSRPASLDSRHERLPRQICIFLLNNLSLPPDKALAVHIQSHDSSPFIFCGAIHAARPSAVLTLTWPDPADQSRGVPLMITRPEGAQARTKIGVSVEDLATLPQVVDAASQGKMERLAMRVGENLFNFMKSFCGVDGDRLVVPLDILDRWFVKFQEKARKDPEFLKGFNL